MTTAAGILYVWGRNNSGLGGGPPGPDLPRPRAVPGVPAMREVRLCGGAALALTGDGQVWSWGLALFGILGRLDGSPALPALPALPAFPTATATDADALDPEDQAGLDRLLAAPRGGTVIVPGAAPCLLPAPVPGLPPIRQLAIASETGLALDHDGQVWSWGHGCLGRRMRRDPDEGFYDARPAPVRGLPPVVSVHASPGAVTAYAIDGDGGLWSWGAGFDGQLGRGKRQSSQQPGRIEGIGPVCALAPDGFSCLALLADGSAVGFGDSSAQVGFCAPNRRSPAVLVPAPVTGLPPLAALWQQGGLAIYRDREGGTWVAGQGLGRLDPTRFPEDAPATPQRWPALDPYAQFWLGGQHGFAMDADGGVVAFGRTEAGAPGTGDTDPDGSLAPTPLALPGRPLTMAADASASAAILPD